MVTLALSPGDPRTRSQKAKDALAKELGKLRERNCWDEKNVVEWEEVKRKHPGAHMATIFPLVGIKNHEQAEEFWKWKGRIVLGGHNIKSTHGDKIAMFQDTASTPSSMAAARAIIAAACLTPDSVILQSDCPNAYIQSEFTGPLTYERIPREWWPPAWSGMRDPVCKLLKSLYGHPSAGNGWQRHLEERLAKVGCAKIEDWQSVYFNKDSGVSMVVYVDDLLGAGPEDAVRKAFAELSELVDLDPPEW